MDEVYEAPELALVGNASDLVKAFEGPHTDGGGYAFSQLTTLGTVEVE